MANVTLRWQAFEAMEKGIVTLQAKKPWTHPQVNTGYTRMISGL